MYDRWPSRICIKLLTILPEHDAPVSVNSSSDEWNRSTRQFLPKPTSRPTQLLPFQSHARVATGTLQSFVCIIFWPQVRPMVDRRLYKIAHVCLHSDWCSKYWRPLWWTFGRAGQG